MVDALTRRRSKEVTAGFLRQGVSAIGVCRSDQSSLSNPLPRPHLYHSSGPSLASLLASLSDSLLAVLALAPRARLLAYLQLFLP